MGGPDSRPSKTQRKRESEALQKLGERLISMPETRFLSIPMPDKLREAVKAARGMTKHRALYRQRQYIGRLMRETEAGGIRKAIEAEEHQNRLAARRFHHIEAWRERLIERGDAVLGELLDEFPDADRQHVRQLVREAQHERRSGKPPAHARSLFRYLQSLDNEAQAVPPRTD